MPGLLIGDAITQFARDIAFDRSPKTVLTYAEASRLFERFAAETGTTTLETVTPDLIRTWLADLRNRGRKPGTIFNRYCGLKALMRWAVDEQILDANPMDRIPLPKVTPPPIPILADDAIARILAACDGRSFDDVRDAAIIRLLVDTGIRKSECAGLRPADVDTEQDMITVTGKGSRVRSLPVGQRTGRAIRRYLRLRTNHAHASSPSLWVGKRGGLQPDAIRDILRRRAKMAGVTERVFVHQLRHTWAHAALQAMNEGNVQRLGGWRDRDMLSRYAASAADERAIAAGRSNSFGDRF